MQLSLIARNIIAWLVLFWMTQLGPNLVSTITKTFVTNMIELKTEELLNIE